MNRSTDNREQSMHIRHSVNHNCNHSVGKLQLQSKLKLGKLQPTAHTSLSLTGPPLSPSLQCQISLSLSRRCARRRAAAVARLPSLRSAAPPPSPPARRATHGPSSSRRRGAAPLVAAPLVAARLSSLPLARSPGSGRQRGPWPPPPSPPVRRAAPSSSRRRASPSSLRHAGPGSRRLHGPWPPPSFGAASGPQPPRPPGALAGPSAPPRRLAPRWATMALVAATGFAQRLGARSRRGIAA